MSDTADLIHAYYDTSLPPQLWSQPPSVPRAKRAVGSAVPAAEVEVEEEP